MTTPHASLAAVTLAVSLAACAPAREVLPVPTVATTGSGRTDVLRVMTLNVAHGSKAPVPAVFFRASTTRRNLSDIATLVRDVAPDVVALEELDRRSFYSNFLDHYAWIREESGLPHAAFGAHRDVRTGPFAMRHGTALLSAFPLERPESAAFHTSFVDDKGLVVATLAPPAFSGREVDVVALHLDPLFEGARRAQVRQTIAKLRSRGARPLVVMGDMNASWKEGRGALGDLARGLDLQPYLAPDAADTFPAGKHPWRRIDWILISRDLKFEGYRTLDAKVSDHRAVVAEIAPR